MLLQQQTAVEARRGRIRRFAVPAAAFVLALVAGCSHSRTSYRPIFSRSLRPAAPCTNCGGSSASIIRDEAVSSPMTTVPSLSGPSIDSDVSVPSDTVPSDDTSSRTIDSSVETPPSARIGSEPDYDPIPSEAPRGRNSAKPSVDKYREGTGHTPPLQGPSSNTPASTWNTQGARPRRAQTASATAGARPRGAAIAALRPYLTSDGAHELVAPNKADRPWRYIVLHHSASATGNYDQIDQEHRKVLGQNGCGYHFIIGNGTGSGDGQIEVAQRWNNQKQGIHCRNARSHAVDEYGIGICLVGDLDREPPTPRQVAAAHALIEYLSQRYRIEAGRIATHAHLAATPTVCPGKFFPAQSILVVDRDRDASAPSSTVAAAPSTRATPNGPTRQARLPLWSSPSSY